MKSRIAEQQQDLTNQFIYFASKVSGYFPDLDLRFNLQNGSNLIRYTAPKVSKKVFELALGAESVEELVHSATFALKEATRRFDA